MLLTTMPKRQMDPVMEEVFKKFTKTSLAAELGLSKMAVSHWRRVPSHHVRRVSQLTGISIRRLRPDLYAYWHPFAKMGDDVPQQTATSS